MFFPIDRNFKEPVENTKIRLFRKARAVINLYPMGVTEVALNKYLLSTYHKNLKTLCHLILLNASIMNTDNNEIIITFKDKNWEAIAQLITFGNGKIAGSKILQKAFK